MGVEAESELDELEIVVVIENVFEVVDLVRGVTTWV